MATQHYCKTCGEEIHPKRVALGYSDTCVKHSTTAPYKGFVVSDGKTDYSVEIVRDPQAIKDMSRLSTKKLSEL